VVFGSNPKGHKQQQGDERTPEGEYVLDYKNTNSSYYKSIHISYPNDQDRENAKKLGVSPGGDIMIHGQPNRWGKFSLVTQLFNWTNGCIALSNSDMDAVWNAVDPGTPIQIRP
jgi:murein L,D-transpeptidase YafK